jgi:hypothetical protein
MPKRNSPSKKTREKFLRDLGSLVFWFAFAENGISLIAIQLLGGPKVARAVLPSMHLERTIELVRELARQKYATSEHRAAFDAALLAFKRCATERNQLLHSVAFPEVDPVDGKQVISIVNARAMKVAARELDHVSALETRVRDVSGQVFSIALAMRMFSKRKAPSATP